MILHPPARAPEVVPFWRDYARRARDEVTGSAAFMTSTDGAQVMAIDLCCVESIEAAERTVSQDHYSEHYA